LTPQNSSGIRLSNGYLCSWRAEIHEFTGF